MSCLYSLVRISSRPARCSQRMAGEGLAGSGEKLPSPAAVHPLCGASQPPSNATASPAPPPTHPMPHHTPALSVPPTPTRLLPHPLGVLLRLQREAPLVLQRLLLDLDKQHLKGVERDAVVVVLAVRVVPAAGERAAGVRGEESREDGSFALFILGGRWSGNEGEQHKHSHPAALAALVRPALRRPPPRHAHCLLQPQLAWSCQSTPW